MNLPRTTLPLDRPRSPSLNFSDIDLDSLSSGEIVGFQTDPFMSMKRQATPAANRA